MPAGNVQLDIFEPRGSSNYYIRSMTGKGLDLRNEPLTVADLGNCRRGRRVVASVGSAQVDHAWGLARADAEGRVSLRMAPGEYVAVAWSLANDPTVPLDAYVRARMSTVQRVTLQPNETTTVEVQTREP